MIGPGTLAAVVRPASIGVNAAMLSAGSLSTASWDISINTSGKVRLVCNANVSGTPAGQPAMSANAWYLVAVTKATGTVTPRHHHYVYSTRAWTHIDATGTMVNSLTPTTRAALGVNRSGTGDFWDGDIAAAAAWNVVLSDAQVESLATEVSLTNWVPASGAASACKAMWIMNQPTVATTTIDVTGGGASQSAIVGTTITADDFPLFNASVPSRLASPAWAA